MATLSSQKRYERLAARARRGFVTIGLLLLAAAATLGITRFVVEVLNAKQLDLYINAVSAQLPQNSDPDSAEPQPANPDKALAAIAIAGQDWIGVLEIPSLNLRLPVSAAPNTSPVHATPTVHHGSPYGDSFIITAPNYQTQFFHLTALADNAKIIFTDMTGQVFTYRVQGIGDIPVSAEAQLLSQAEPWQLTLAAKSLSNYQWVIVRCVRD